MQSSTPVSAPIEPKDLAPYIDHTLLKPEATPNDIQRLCEEARLHSFKAVCVNPIIVKATREFLQGSSVLTASVIGFPLGAHHREIKIVETELAVREGASEIDMVIRLDLVKIENWQGVEDDVAAVVKAASGAVVKVILETGLLTTDQIINSCRAAENAGAHFVKTATGFLGRGATVDDVRLMRRSCSAKVQIKASGGIKTFEQAVAMIEAGATRLGTSSGVALVTSAAAGGGY